MKANKNKNKTLPLNELLNYSLLIWGNHPDHMQNQPLNQMDNQHDPASIII
jgi:hypothetical protein